MQKMLKGLREDDTIYVSDLTRITRSTRDLFELVDYIKHKKANLKSLKDSWLDLSEENPYSQFLMTVKQICKITNVSRSALYRRISEEVNN